MPSGLLGEVHRTAVPDPTKRRTNPAPQRQPWRSPMTVISLNELRETALIAGPELELAPAEAIVEWAVDTFGSRFCITSSMGDAVLAHLASRVSPGIDVVFLDTGYHFAETIGTRDAVEATMPVNVVTLSPTISV